ncbi:unnamed protein product [Spodoptera littoralis]|uniref:Uncharacterized protein n=2 Tax=Spodoptera TaxID=7106 RepID=A0A9P0I9D0_SPOLI|nr:uncharacterized protein LOC111358027 [Spodoptera litura]CAB3512594.1 unnamed protein product [Spodoptera littoralis]CAH1642549.1 unnamed protein product [Spodoptera littoralis]
MDFKNKVVIVTGASSGIGAASAVLFAKHGAKLTLIGRNEQRLEAVAKKCQDANGIPPLCLRLDLTAAGSCAAVITKTIATYDRIDVLVNCAAKMLIGSLFDDNIDTFDEMIDINLRVPYKLTHLALPYLIKTKGNIVNLHATKYTKVVHGFLPYAISKAGLERFTRFSAVELATEGVRVNAVQPGLTRTNILANLAMGEDEMEHTYEHLSNKMKILDPEEVAKMVVFVASEVCPNLNGSDIGLTGASWMI